MTSATDNDKMLRITGKTYDYKHLLVEYGALWEKDSKTWLMPESRWNLLRNNCIGGFNKKARDQSAAIEKWVAEPVSVDAKAAALDVEDDQQQDANARLISTAPELLWALREIVNQMDQGGQGSTAIYNRDACISAARRVIAKATGEQS
jgi:hypothetical protein